jgi:tetratricopeptide (TPR) repeat protein
MDDAAVNYNIAVCYYKLGRYGEAANAFRQVSNRFGSLQSLAQYNLGLSLLRQGRDAQARAAFERARAGSDAKLAELAETALQRLGAQPPPAAPRPAQRTALIDMRVGRDDNVALVESPSLLAGESSASPLAEVFAFIAAPLPAGTRFDYDASAYAVGYADAGRFNQNAVSLAARYRPRFGNWRAAFGPRLTYSTLGGTGFETQIGAEMTLRRPLSRQVDLILSAVHDRIDSASSQYAFVAGRRDRVRVGLSRAWEDKRLSLYYEREENDRSDAAVSPTRNTFSIGYRQRLTGPWTLELNLWSRSSRYGALAEPRHEDLRELRVGAGRALASGWRVDGEYLRASNASSAAGYAYGRNRLAIGASKTF